MAIDPQEQARLVNWLEDQGHTPQEIDTIMGKVAEYDARTMHESLFDAIDRGEIDLGSMVKEALGGAGEGNPPV